MNFSKASLNFSPNTYTNLSGEISSLFNIQFERGVSTYMGLPSIISRKKSEVLSYIKERVWQKIQQWSSKNFSRAGKEVLIKSVAQLMPTYTINIFLFPKTLCSETKRLLNAF